MNASVKALIILVLTVPAVSALAQRPARGQAAQNDQYLESVLKANRNLKCKGKRKVVRWYTRDNKRTTTEVYETITRDGAKNRTEYSGNAELEEQIAVDDGKRRLHFYPSKNAIHKMPSLVSSNRSRLEMMLHDRSADFKIVVSEGRKIARKETRLIVISSERGFTHKIWVDKKGLAIVRREMVSQDGGQGMSYEFRYFRYFDSINPKEFDLDMPGVPVLTPEDRLRQAVKELGYKMYKLNGAGKFVLQGARVIEREDRESVVSRYGDGRVVVTLVQYKGEFDPDRFSSGGSRRFQAHAWQKDGYNFALLGDLPLPELKRLSNLVRQ